MTGRLLWLIALAGAALHADERADRDAVRRAIGALNERNWRAATITSAPAALAKFEALLRGKTLTYRIRPGAGRPVIAATQHGMFGRGRVKAQAPSIELQNPRVVAGAVRLVAENTAEADASLVEWIGKQRRDTPLLFVLTREDEVWKIAELRVLP